MSPQYFLDANNLPPLCHEAFNKCDRTIVMVGEKWRRGLTKVEGTPVVLASKAWRTGATLIVPQSLETAIRRLIPHGDKGGAGNIVVLGEAKWTHAEKWSKKHASPTLASHIGNLPCTIYSWSEATANHDTWVQWLTLKTPRAVFSATKLDGRPYLNSKDWISIFESTPMPRQRVT